MSPVTQRIVHYALAVLFCFVACGTAQTPTLEFERSMVRAGERVKLTCSYSKSFPDESLQFRKQGPLHDGNATWYVLSNHETPMSHELPYKFSLVVKENIKEYIMEVDSVQGTMSGNYSCLVKNADSLIDLTSYLNVTVEPTSVKLYIDGVEIEPNSTKEYNYSSTHRLQCVANGSNPAAIFKITHGNQNLNINYSIGNETRAEPPQPNWPFLAVTSRSSNATIADWRVDVTYQAAELSCIAMATNNSRGRTVSFRPVAKNGPPHFVCADEHALPASAEDGFEVTCLLSKPYITEATFMCNEPYPCLPFSSLPANAWHPKPDTVFSGKIENADVTPSLQIQQLFTARMTLKVRMKRENIIGRKYTFEAGNELGKAMHQITFVDSATTGAARMMSSAAVVSSLLTLLLLTMVIHI